MIVSNYRNGQSAGKLRLISKNLQRLSRNGVHSKRSGKAREIKSLILKDL